MIKKILISALALSMPIMRVILIGSEEVNLAICDFVLILIVIHIAINFLAHTKELLLPKVGLFYVFICITFISTLSSLILLTWSQPLSVTAIELVKFNMVVIYFLVIHLYFNRKDELDLFFKYWVIISIFEVLLGLYGYITQNPNYALYFRIFGTLGNPNLFAMYINASVFISLYMYLTFQKKFYLFTTILFIIGVIASASRAATVGLILAFLYFLLYRSKKKLKLLVASSGIALILILILFFSQMESTSSVNRISKLSEIQTEENFGERLHFWQAGLKMIENYPLLGVGKGNFVHAAKTLVGTGGYKFSIAHNTYISIACEIGIPGLLIFIFLIFQVMFNLDSSVRKSSLLAKIIFSILIAFLTQAVLMNIENVRFFWLIMAIGFEIERFSSV